MNIYTYRKKEQLKKIKNKKKLKNKNNWKKLNNKMLLIKDKIYKGKSLVYKKL